MASPTCPFCNQPIRAGAKFCAKCGRTLVAPPVPSSNAAGVTCPKCRAPNRAGAKFCANCRAPLAAPGASQNVGVKCLQCGTFNRVGARFCAKCRSDLSARAPVVNVPCKRGEKERGLSSNTWRIFAALGAGALVLLCLVGALVTYTALGKPTAVAINPSPAPTPGASAAPLSPISPTQLPGSAPSVPPPTPRSTRAPDATPAPTASASDWVNYANSTGEYALRYPPAWPGSEVGGDAGFELPDDFFIEILIDRAAPGKTVAEYARDLDWLGSAVVQSAAPAQIGGENAMRLQVAERGATQMTAVLYVAIHNGKLYLFSLRGVYGRAPVDMSGAIGQFDELIKSFRFTR